MQIERVSVDSLVFDPVNARKHSKRNLDAIKGSLAKFGQQKPLVVDKNNVVIAGNGTLQAARELGWAEVDVHRTVLTGAEAMAFALADNKTAELAEWDEDILSEHLAALYKDGWDIEDIGFSVDDLDFDGGTEGNTDPDEVPEVEENKFGVSRGQIWQLGEHRVMCGDSTDKQDVEKLMAGEKADMVFTDPPYGIEYDDETKTKWDRQTRTSKAKANNFGQIANDDIPVGVFVEKILEFFGYANRVFIWGVLNGNGNVPKGSFIVWDKKNEAQAKCPFGDFDICWSKNVGWKMLRHIWGGFVSKEKDEPRWHPTQKPVSLVEDFFERWGNRSDAVVDLFLGSGSTLIACEKTGRKCYGMEIDPHYCSVIIERWQNYTGRQAELVKKPTKAKG